MNKISVTILTKNCQETLKKTLTSVGAFSEVVILDTGSTDSTLEIARTFPNVKIYTSEFLGFGPTHNSASELASHDWILSLDSDEILTPELKDEILNAELDFGTVYSVLRHNYFNGKHIKWCAGWHPDRVIRLYHKRTTRFNDAAVHEKILQNGLRKVFLKHPIIHTPYREIGDFLSKMQTYSTLFAKQNYRKKSPSLLKAILHAWYAFFKSYILKRGCFGGREGFIISIYNSHSTFYKYLKLMEANRLHKE